MRLGLDLHGVIDDDYELFVSIAFDTIAFGGEVHIITGSRALDVVDEIDGFPHTHFFSLADYYKDKSPAKYYYFVNQDEWNASKAVYCLRNAIDLMIDDSEHYGQYFKTPYELYKPVVIANE